MVAVGGVICHLLLIPPWVFCTVLPCVGTAVLVQRMQLAVLVVQVVLSMLAYQKPKSGVPVALLSTAISYALYLRGDTVGFAGSFIYSAMQWVNWGFTFPYVPAFTRLIFYLDMSSYYKKCRPTQRTPHPHDDHTVETREPSLHLARCELRGALTQMGRSRTLYLFHPHGVITVRGLRLGGSPSSRAAGGGLGLRLCLSTRLGLGRLASRPTESGRESSTSAPPSSRRVRPAARLRGAAASF